MRFHLLERIPQMPKKFKKFKIKKYFSDHRDLIKETSKLKDVCYLVAPRIKDTFKILYDLDSVNSPILVEKPISTSVRDFSAKMNKKKNIFVGYNEYFTRRLNILN